MALPPVPTGLDVRMDDPDGRVDHLSRREEQTL